MSRLRLLPALVLAACTFVSSQAIACWDGFDAHVGNVEVRGDDEQWNVGTLQHHAQWMGRIDALIPADTTIMASSAIVIVTIAGVDHEFTWSNGQYRTLFDDIARNVGASAIAQERALRTKTPVYVVQAGAFLGLQQARTRAEAISDSGVGEHGFFEAGGFPANNPTAHVVTIHAARTFHRVYVGAFVTRADAEALSKRIGQGAFVRDLSDEF